MGFLKKQGFCRRNSNFFLLFNYIGTHILLFIIKPCKTPLLEETKNQGLKLKVFQDLCHSFKTPPLEETKIQDLKLSGLSRFMGMVQLQDLNLIF